MQRTVNVLAVACSLLFVLTMGLWITSYVTGLHAGEVTIEIDENGVKQELRDGCFIQHGRLAYGFGTRIHWPDEGPKLPPLLETRRGVFIGDFWPWADDRRFLLGFGVRRGVDPDLVSIPALAGESLTVSIPVAWWALLFLAAPFWRRAGARLQLSPEAVLINLLVTWGLLVAFAAVAVPLPGLGGLILLYLGIVTTWAVGRYGLRTWQELRAARQAGRCRVCGYDLRATPDPAGPPLERCPECGTFSKPLRPH